MRYINLRLLTYLHSYNDDDDVCVRRYQLSNLPGFCRTKKWWKVAAMTARTLYSI